MTTTTWSCLLYTSPEVLLVGEERAAGHVHGVARYRTDGLVEHVLEGFALYRLVDLAVQLVRQLLGLFLVETPEQMCIRDRGGIGFSKSSPCGTYNLSMDFSW